MIAKRRILNRLPPDRVKLLAVVSCGCLALAVGGAFLAGGWHRIACAIAFAAKWLGTSAGPSASCCPKGSSLGRRTSPSSRSPR